MALKWERMELLSVMVTDFDQAVEDYTKTFGVEFVVQDLGDTPEFQTVSELEPEASGAGGRVAIDRTLNFELTEIPKGEEGFECIHFKVDDIEEARRELSHLTIYAEYTFKGLREILFTGEALHGIVIAVTQYDDRNIYFGG